MGAACALARRHGAHLIGLHTIEALMVYPAVAMHIPDAVYETYGASQLEASAALKTLFERHTHAEDFVSEWRLLKSDTETAADRIVESARSVDVVMMAAAAPDRPTAHSQLLETVIRTSGRPVIAVPPGYEADSLGQTVLIGWNASREAARAAHDALALMDRGDTAHILRVDDSKHDPAEDSTSTDLAAAFARHGIETTLVRKTWQQPGVAALMNKEAFEKGADLIAIGAFGHSRAYDFVIGAASRELLRDCRLPVLFSR
jgi:nucleotide-binding universal stress UspA family protein